MSKRTLNQLKKLKENTKNYRLNYNKYSKKEMRTLTRLASQVSGENVNEKDIKKQFKTFHSAINYYTNIEGTIDKDISKFNQEFNYNLDFIKRLTNENINRMNNIERNKKKMDYLTLFNKKMEVVTKYLNNAKDFQALVENGKSIFKFYDYEELKHFSVDNIDYLYSQILSYGTKLLTGRQKTIEYYTQSYTSKEDIQATKDIIKERTGKAKQDKTWFEFKHENEDNYNFIESLLNVKLVVKTRNGELRERFQMFAKKTIKIPILWQMVDKYREMNDRVINVGGYDGFVAFLLETLGTQAFVWYFFQSKYYNNVATIEVQK